MKTKPTPPWANVTGPLLSLDTIGATRQYRRRSWMTERLTRVEAKALEAAPPSISASSPVDPKPITIAGQILSLTLTGDGTELYRGIVE